MQIIKIVKTVLGVKNKVGELIPPDLNTKLFLRLCDTDNKINRSMKQSRKSRIILTHIWTIEF